MGAEAGRGTRPDPPPDIPQAGAPAQSTGGELPGASGLRPSGLRSSGLRPSGLWPSGLFARVCAFRRGLVGLGLSLMALALLLLVPRGPALAPPLRLVIADLSPSATRVRRDSTIFLRRYLAAQDREAREAGEELAVVVFGAPGAPCRRVFGPAAGGRLSEDLRRGPANGLLSQDLAGHGARAGGGGPGAVGLAADSELGAALGLAEGILREQPRQRCRLVLLSDGTYTGPDPRPAWKALAEGASTSVERWPGPDLPDAAVVGLSLPREVEVGAPLAVAVELGAQGSARDPARPPVTELTVSWRDGHGGGVRQLPVEWSVELPVESPAEWPVEWPVVAGASGAIPAGLWRAHLSVPLGPAAPGITEVTARVSAAGDPLPENDWGQAGTRAGPDLICAVLVGSGAPAPERVEEVRRWLAGGAAPDGPEVGTSGSVGPGSGTRGAGTAVDGLQLRFWEVGELGRALGEADVLWTSGVPVDLLDGELLRSFVESGGGWLASGGWELLQGWLPVNSARLPQSLLPLQPEEPDSERDVILVVDGSGSMAGEPFEEVRRGVLELARASLAGDHLALRFFTGVLGPDETGADRSGTAGAHIGAPTGARAGAGRRRETLLGILAARVPGGTTDVLYSLDQLAEERSGRERRALVLLLTDGRTALWEAERARAVAGRLAAAGVHLRVFPIGADADREFLGQLVAEGEGLVEVAELSELGELFQREVNQQRVREGAALELRVVGAGGRGPGS
ncbi:MAG TPA: vWA domain-containing protein, partial [Planctomycetota bacterium]|nr:vWA domain-containing protein [Planctomycetota bacterium]